MIPQGWENTTLGEAFHWSSGGTPTRSVAEYYGGQIPWAVIGDLKDGILSSTANSITQSGLANSSAKWAEPGSVLIAMYGSIGKLGIAARRLTTNQAIAFTQPDPIRSKFLFYYLMHSRAELVEQGKGGTQQNISQTVLRAFAFRLAPLPEQDRIVAVIEEQLSRVDAGVEALERVKKELERYRASVLKDACEARLVPTEAELARADRRSFEPATELLARILAERRARWDRKKKYVEPAPPDTSSLPALPEGWAWATMEQLTSAITSGSRDWSPFYDKGRCVFIMAQNVRPGRLDLSFRQLVDPPIDDPSRERSAVKPADLLVTIVGANTGDVCRVSSELPDHFVCQSVALMRPADARVSPYLEAFLVSPEPGRKQFDKFMYGQGRPHLSFDHLAATIVAFPPIAEQHRIVAEVERRLSIADEVAATVDSALTRATRLRQAILKRAFEGRLVPQDPNDEPASALLERIRAERAAGENGKPRARRQRVTGSDARPDHRPRRSKAG